MQDLIRKVGNEVENAVSETRSTNPVSLFGSGHFLYNRETMYDFVGGITSTTIGIGILLAIINFEHTCLSKFCVIDHSFYHSETIIFILTFP